MSCPTCGFERLPGVREVTDCSDRYHHRRSLVDLLLAEPAHHFSLALWAALVGFAAGFVLGRWF